MASIDDITPLQEQRLCDWERSVANCTDSSFVKVVLIVCASLHCLAGALGTWVLWYRNGGFKASIVTNLFFIQSGTIRPRPIDCTALFMTIACFLRIPSNVLTVLNWTPMWFRMALEMMYWWTGLIVMVVTYVVGVLYAIPVTECKGTFAVYQPQKLDPSSPKSPIFLFYPTPSQRDAILIIGLAFPIIFGMAPGVASAALEEQGHLATSRILYSVQNTAWAATELVWACIVMYYGLKFSFILRAHIMATEARDHLPLVNFGPADLMSGSPARYLLAMIQISAGGGCLALSTAGLVTIVWAWFEDTLARPENERWSHLITVAWTCGATLIYFIKLGLIAVHCNRNKRERVRGLGACVSQESAVVVRQDSSERLTLHLETNESCSEATKTLEHALSVITIGRRPVNEEAWRAGGAQYGTDECEYEDHSNSCVHPSAAMGLCKLTKEAGVSGATTTFFQQDPQVQAFLLLKHKHESLVQRIEDVQLDHKQQRRRAAEQYCGVLQRHLLNAHQSLEKLQAHYSQLQSLQQVQGEESVRRNPVGGMQDAQQASGMSMLQKQLEFTLQQLEHQIECCHSNLAL
ncbi:unnamed protein product [Mortierella alpina]